MIYNDKDQVIGVRTKERGIDSNGNKKEDFEDSMNIQALVTVLAEGARGSLTLKAIQKFKLDESSKP